MIDTFRPPPAAAPRPARKFGSAGLLPWIFPAIIALGALDMFLSGRDLAQSFVMLEQVAAPERSPIMVWVQRAVSLMLLLASVEQIANHFSLRRPLPSAGLLLAFILYWVGTIASPALFGTVPTLSHEYLYSLALGVAACLVGEGERDRIVRAARDALFALMLVGLALVPLHTSLVLDLSYSQGIIPGLPRFAGLTPHPVTQGMLAQVALLVLWCVPFKRRWLNLLAWAMGLLVLFIAQSKTSWLAFGLCAAVLMVARSGGEFWQRMSDPRRGGVGVLVCLGVMLVVLGLGAWVLLGDAFGRAEDFYNSPQGAALATMTGRDRIWAAALQEWNNNPMFGYGLTIWDNAYRVAIGLPNATHAHNQFMDDLARAGNMGAGALLIYAPVLLVMSLRYARASGGLAIALFATIAIRAISEVPLMLMGYGAELFTHLLLLVTLAAAASARRQAAPARSPLRYGVAT
ncbi:MAG TPA: O-antigen ligase family protein [Ramlibacter sp.]|nr:O-antigen ligase family protein [Ramlibacter sp.]